MAEEKRFLEHNFDPHNLSARISGIQTMKDEILQFYRKIGNYTTYQPAFYNVYKANKQLEELEDFYRSHQQ